MNGKDHTFDLTSEPKRVVITIASHQATVLSALISLLPPHCGTVPHAPGAMGLAKNDRGGRNYTRATGQTYQQAAVIRVEAVISLEDLPGHGRGKIMSEKA